MIALLLLFAVTTHAAEVGVKGSIVQDAAAIVSAELNPSQTQAIGAFLAAPMPGPDRVALDLSGSGGPAAALPESMDRVEAAIKLSMIHGVLKTHDLASADALRLLRARTAAISSVLTPEGRDRLDAAMRQTAGSLRGMDRDAGGERASEAAGDASTVQASLASRLADAVERRSFLFAVARRAPKGLRSSMLSAKPVHARLVTDNGPFEGDQITHMPNDEVLIRHLTAYDPAPARKRTFVVGRSRRGRLLGVYSVTGNDGASVPLGDGLYANRWRARSVGDELLALEKSLNARLAARAKTVLNSLLGLSESGRR